MADQNDETELEATIVHVSENKSATNGIDLLKHQEINGNEADSADVTASMAANLTAHVIADVIADVNLLSNENNIIQRKENTGDCDDVVDQNQCHHNIIQNNNELIVENKEESIANTGNEGDDNNFHTRTINEVEDEPVVQNENSSNEFIELKEVVKSSENIDFSISETQEFKIEEKTDACLPTTLITVESKNIKSDLINFDLIKPGDDDSDVEMDRVYKKKETADMNCENDEESEFVSDDGCLIGFENSAMNVTIENNKQEINGRKTSKYFEDDDDDDDDILVFDKPPVAVTTIAPPQSAEIVLEGIAEEPEDVKEEEFDSVIIKDDEKEDDDEKPVDELMRLEELEEDKVEKKHNEPFSENICETIERKIRREEDSLEKFQQQEKQLEEQAEQEKQQLIKQQKQTDHHEYVNVPQLSPKRPSDEGFTSTEQTRELEDLAGENLASVKSSHTIEKEDVVADTATEHEANKAIISEDDFNFEMEKEDHRVIDDIKNDTKKEIENYTQNELENNKQNEKEQKVEKVVVNEIEKTDLCVSGLNNDAGNYIKNKNVIKVEEKDIKKKKQFEASKNIISEPKQKNDFKSTTSQFTTQASSVRTTSQTPTCRTPTTPGTPNASSYIRYNDILPEAGCVKALVEQWSKRSSRADGLEDKGMNRSRSCGPISRKLKQMSPENELEHPLGAANQMSYKESCDKHNLYNSQPSLTRSILHKFEQLDQQASQKAIPKKAFKWEVKEAKILKRPTYLPH